ncbi:MAG: toprim domain-containing protein [Holosporaceae bacterium]|jgi:putative DNA primase/helicase|nr:toprim domain-containing protein [Holosporaceae bacterium]
MVDFRRIKEAYRQNPLCILKQLISNGKVEGSDYVAKNPRRNDRKAGSFRIDIATGKFNDFATRDRGGDIIDLAAFVYNCNAVAAADRLSRLFFSSLGGNKSAVPEDLPVKKKKIDPNYIWSESIKSEDHEYLRRKRICSGNARVNIYGGRKQLVIPLIDSIPNKNLKGLQFIREDGSKSFPLPFRGLFHVVSGGQCNLIVIAEGYATARSIYEATRLFVIAAMSACNMKAVALKIRELFPYSDIVIATDNDITGRRAAEEASRALGRNVQIIYPMQGKDFNDMLVKVGSDSLKFHILSSIKTETAVYD